MPAEHMRQQVQGIFRLLQTLETQLGIFDCCCLLCQLHVQQMQTYLALHLLMQNWYCHHAVCC